MPRDGAGIEGFYAKADRAFDIQRFEPVIGGGHMNLNPRAVPGRIDQSLPPVLDGCGGAGGARCPVAGRLGSGPVAGGAV